MRRLASRSSRNALNWLYVPCVENDIVIESNFLPPAEMTKLLERETATWAQAIKAAHIRLD